MPLSINTNISSLTAQRAIADSKSDLETAMERLSTGSKINSASDDAAGLAMAQRMTAQIKGLNMAVKNSSDGIAMTKSIEGAITEVSDMLQRMRELSVQAANGTNSASDRTYLQDEVNLLIQEINRISANTRYNGSLVLDGTFINKQLQVGVEEGEHISLSVDSIAANQIGAHTLIGNGVNPEGPGAQPPGNPVTAAEDIEIFGYIGTKVIEASAGDSAKDTAVKVNLSTADTGVRAYANTYAALSSSDEQSRTYNLKINGYQTGNFVISSNNVRDAVESINRISGASGVTASAQNNKVVLFDSDGDDITIENTKAGDEFVDLVVEKLGQDGDVYNVIGDPVSLAQGSTSQISGVNAVYNAAAGTLANYSGDTVIGDGTNSITVSHLAAPADLDALVTAIQAATGYSDLLFEVSANSDGTSLDFTYKSAGVITTAPTFTQDGANDEGGDTPAIYNIAVGTLANYNGDTVLSDGTNSVTIDHTGATLGAAVAEIENIQIRGVTAFAGTTTLSDGTNSVSLDHSTTSPTDMADLIAQLQGVNTAVAEVKGLTLGDVTTYNGDFVLSDGTESITLDFSVSAPADVATLVTAIQAHNNYGNLAFTVAADTAGTGLALTASTAGSAGTTPTLTYVAGGASATSTVSTITAGSDTYADLDFTIAIGADGVSIDATAGTAGATGISATLTSSSGGTVSAATVGTAGKDAMDLATLVTQIQSDANYSSLAFTVAAGSDGSSLDLTYKADSAPTAVPTLDNATAVDEGTASVAQVWANGTVTETTAGTNSGDSTRISGTLKFVSSASFSVEQAGNADGNSGYFAAGSQTAALIDLTQVKISTELGASDAISIIDAALDKVAQMRSDLGAIENRMDHTVSNLMNIAEKTADSRSRLEDADFALESARLAKNQVLQQAGTSMLSQANQMSQLVMELLRG
jgi:flagellin